jgi:hypothetical protein
VDRQVGRVELMPTPVLEKPGVTALWLEAWWSWDR